MRRPLALLRQPSYRTKCWTPHHASAVLVAIIPPQSPLLCQNGHSSWLLGLLGSGREGVPSFVNHQCKVPPNFMSHSTNGILSHHARPSHTRGDDGGHLVVQLPNLPKRGQVLPSPVRPPASCASGVIFPAVSLGLSSPGVCCAAPGRPPGRHSNINAILSPLALLEGSGIILEYAVVAWHAPVDIRRIIGAVRTLLSGTGWRPCARRPCNRMSEV